MKIEDFKIGTRVRLIRDIESDPFFFVPKGHTGVVVEINLTYTFAYVKLDQHVPGLDDWDNILQVWTDDSDVTGQTNEAFELI